MQANTVIEGDCLDVMGQFPDNCIDTIITDPPYGLSFMGKNWDHGLPGVAYWREALRVSKPGATLLAFGGTRTHHRLMVAIEDAGWEIRDVIMWLYGSGYPKSHDVSKAIDKAAIVDCPKCDGGVVNCRLEYSCIEHGAIEEGTKCYCGGLVEYTEEYDLCLTCNGTGKVKGVEREVVGIDQTRYRNINGHTQTKYNQFTQENYERKQEITAPSTPLAAKFSGYGSALKPAYEPIIVAMKPLDGTYAENAERWDLAGLWIDGARVETNGEAITFIHSSKTSRSNGILGKTSDARNGQVYVNTNGRWPANIIHDGSNEVEAEFSKAGVSRNGKVTFNSNTNRKAISTRSHNARNPNLTNSVCNYGDSGTPSRFFYTAKSSPSERGDYNNHPTVKPLELLKYLARLTRPPDGGIVLDMFAGSGTTGLACIAENRDYILIELNPKGENYIEIIRRRIAEYTGQEIAPKEVKLKDRQIVKQLGLW